MDDCNNLPENVQSAQERNKIMEQMLESKLLDINHEKSNSITIGARKARDKLKLEAQKNSPEIGNHKLKISNSLAMSEVTHWENQYIKLLLKGSEWLWRCQK